MRGNADATDYADVALHLVSASCTSLRWVVSWGVSAGGSAVLYALATTDVFAVRAARAAVVGLKE
ncbi:prolyl oligopeptidase family serine peptidase [Streptosporangium sp. NPDC001681]|uniref:prolyl oligopeptidase family serine peptidase n=1 Tax=Streptosporangium sp. NPDC001681 TaxID=3154395 RepID=UPI00332E1D80